GQVFPQAQTAMFPRLERFDVEFDIPEAFLPEFPPAIFLQNRPELGDVSRGEVVSINNFHRLFKDILTPVQLSGLQFLLTPLPQVSPMAHVQNMLAFPPASKLNKMTNRLDPKLASEAELRGEKLFFGKAQCASCHSGPAFLDHQLHDLGLERFTKEPGDGPIK